MSKQHNQRPGYLLREFDRPMYLASHFGFLPIECPKITDKDISMTEDYESKDTKEKAAFIRNYVDKGFASLSHPLALAYKKSSNDYSLHVVGLPSASAEALLLRTSLSILGEYGHKQLVVEVNSMGDKDSISAYERELHTYMKKLVQTEEFSAEQKKLLKSDIYELLNLDLPTPLKDHLPASIASLTSASRAHFKDMLEHLEALGVEFRLAHTLHADKEYSSHTVFNIRDLEDESLLAEGSRYSRLTKKFGFKKELPIACMNIFHKNKEASKTYKDLPKAKFHLIQLGPSAKMKVLPLIELLRQNRIPVYHSIGKDKITAQLSSAEALRTPYLLIVGQKEAIDNTVTIRNSATRAQETVGIDILPDYLKNLTF
jgi:histidyl-tRNA synthetase